jgi:hypothetical protein
MALVDVVRVEAPIQRRRAFFSPMLDFLLLGGGSLLLLPILLWVIPDDYNIRAIGVGFLLSTVINHPHFAHSYQIFYRTFPSIAFSTNTDWTLRARYLWAGVGAPLLLTAFLTNALVREDKQALGYAANAMMFIVGWHYVKQGYGVLMVDAALQRSFFQDSDKRVLQVNSYLCWIVAWLATNRVVYQRNLWGMSYATIDAPDGLLWVGAAAVTVSTFYAAWILLRHARAHRRAVPVTGIVAYVAALYPWVFLIGEPVLVFLIPAMHALQYLAIVWRYQINLESTKLDATARPDWVRLGRFVPSKAKLRFAGFVALGITLGYCGFCLIPTELSAAVPYDHEHFGDSIFVFVFYILINIHHYFIDNAMWRKENPHTLQHLFTHG